jgi:hypothetical protein
LKKLFSGAVALALLLTGIISLPTQAADVLPGECTNGFLGISGTEVTGSLGCTGEAVIPASVTTIGSSAFEDSSDVHTITFESGSQLTAIEPGAFAFSGITAITIPAGVTSLDYRSFYYTADLTTISFAAGSLLETIDDEAFVHSGITAITIPASVSSIGTKAFERTDDLGAVSFGAGSLLTSLPIDAFHYSGLRSIVLPSGLTTISAGAFYNNTRLSSVTIPATVTSIGNEAFGSTTSLTTVRFEGLAAPTLGTDVFLDTAPLATASIKYNATGFILVAGLWNGLLVSRDQAPVSSSPAGPIPTTISTITKSFALNSPFLASQQKKVLRKLIREVGSGGSFEVVAGVVREPSQTKKQAKALALAKARVIKRYLVLRGVKKKDISLKTKVYKVGVSPKTQVLGFKPNSP